MPFPWEKSLFYMAKFLPRFTDKLQIKAAAQREESRSAKLGAFGVTRRQNSSAELHRSHRVSPRKTFRFILSLFR
jgi:hypothetical protein